MAVLGEAKIDCHCHVLDPVAFPFQADTPYRPTGQEVAPVATLLRMMAQNGIHGAVIVGTNSGYGTDLSPLLDALERGEGRFRGVAVVPLDITTAALARLRDRGIVGVAFNAPFHGTATYRGARDLLRRVADLGMWLNLQVREDQLVDLLPLIEGSDVRVVVDHCGRPAPEAGLGQAGFQALLALGRAGRAVVKLSGFSQFSRLRHPYTDATPYVAALLAAFTPAGCVWGSDFPFLRAPERIDVGPLLQLVESWVPAPADRRAILWETPRRLFGFEPQD